ncbi:MAG: hypothetical protein OXU39_05015 [Gemmatimonadota bacterium]|nr:hypothetical protein [Gemmatimonadota bacterium]MDE3005435.1 hypothetical protein [Gemmatimonadota bacterium]
MSTEWDALAGRLEDRFMDAADGGDRLEAWAETDFDAFARASFGWQYELCAPYRALCDRRGITPGSIGDWRDIPAVPATAFKYFDFVSIPGGWVDVDCDAVFETSGTTRGAERRGRHVVPRGSLYRASFYHPFRLALLPDLERLPMLSLIPSPAEATASSLSCMVGMAVEEFGDGVDWLVDGEGRWRDDAFDLLGAVRRSGGPVLLLGTALSFVHLIEGVEAGDVQLPAGSRVMETGGFKGARRSIARAELYARIAAHVGVEEQRIVNEYGMTELLSQMYEPVLIEGVEAQGRHVAPPWLRVRILDPTTLEERPDGNEGLIAFFDLANLGSVNHILTEDVGVIEAGRLQLLGRATGAEPRGCSRAMDDLMAGAGRVR